MLRITSIAIFTWSIIGNAVHGDEPSALVEKWVQQLGSSDFAEREAATDALVKFGAQQLHAPPLRERGLPALAKFHDEFVVALEKAAQGSDREVAFRARAIQAKVLPSRPLGPGVAGWALYAAWHESRAMPAPVDVTALIRGGLKLTGDEWSQQEAANELRANFGNALMQLMVAKLAATDARAACEWATSDDNPHRRRKDAIVAGLRIWGQQDFSAAIEWARARPGKMGFRRAALDELLSHWPSERSIDEALLLLEALRDQPGFSDGHIRVAYVYAQQNPEKAVDWALRKEWPHIESNLYREVIIAVAHTDAKKAIELSRKLPHDGEGDFGRIGLLASLVEAGKPLDEELVEAVATPTRRPWARYELLRHLLATGRLNDALAYLDEKCTDEDLREHGVARMVEFMARRDPQQALEWLQGRDVGEQKLAQYYLALAWAQTDAPRAAEYARKLPDVNQRPFAICSVADIWAKTDPLAAMKLIDDFPLKPYGVIVEARMRVLDYWARNNPNAAAKWLSEQHEEAIHWRGCQVVGKQWAARDALQACQWALSIDASEPRAHALLGVADGLIDEYDVVIVSHAATGD